MSDYDIQPYNAGSYPLMKALFKAAFDAALNEKAFQKKYNTEALGHPVIGFIAVHTATRTPAAFYGVFPVKVIGSGKEILAAQSGDTMTHPDHQRKGLFVKLAQMTYKVCRQQGIDLVFGQPNQNSYQGLVNRLRFQPLDEIVRYDAKLSFKTFPLPKLCQKAGAFSAYLRFAKALLRNKIVDTPNSFTNPLQTAHAKVLRNEAYLQYKNEEDKIFIRIDGVVLWTKLTDVLWIGEISNYERITPQVLQKLKRLAFALGYNTLRFHLNKSIAPPAFLKSFTAQGSEASCFLYLNEETQGLNLLLTGTDFDTW